MTFRTLSCQIHKIKGKRPRGPCPYCARVQQEIREAPAERHPNRRPKSKRHRPGPKPGNLRTAPRGKPPAY